MSPSAFAIAYRRWLERKEPMAQEPAEPNPSDYGMPPSFDLYGQRVENPVAEPLRLAVRVDWERDVLEKAKTFKAG